MNLPGGKAGISTAHGEINDVISEKENVNTAFENAELLESNDMENENVNNNTSNENTLVHDYAYDATNIGDNSSVTRISPLVPSVERLKSEKAKQCMTVSGSCALDKNNNTMANVCVFGPT